MLNTKEIKVVIKQYKEGILGHLNSCNRICHFYTLLTELFCKGDEYSTDEYIPHEKCTRVCTRKECAIYDTYSLMVELYNWI